MKIQKELRQMKLTVLFACMVNVFLCVAGIGINQLASSLAEPQKVGLHVFASSIAYSLGAALYIALFIQVRGDKSRACVFATSTLGALLHLAGRWQQAGTLLDGELIVPVFYVGCLVYWDQLRQRVAKQLSAPAG